MATELSKACNISWPYQSVESSPLLEQLIRWAADNINDLMEDNRMWQKFINSGGFDKLVIARLQKPKKPKRKRQRTIDTDDGSEVKDEPLCLSD